MPKKERDNISHFVLMIGDLFHQLYQKSQELNQDVNELVIEQFQQMLAEHFAVSEIDHSLLWLSDMKKQRLLRLAEKIYTAVEENNVTKLEALVKRFNRLYLDSIKQLITPLRKQLGMNSLEFIQSYQCGSEQDKVELKAHWFRLAMCPPELLQCFSERLEEEKSQGDAKDVFKKCIDSVFFSERHLQQFSNTRECLFYAVEGLSKVESSNIVQKDIESELLHMTAKPFLLNPEDKFTHFVLRAFPKSEANMSKVTDSVKCKQLQQASNKSPFFAICYKTHQLQRIYQDLQCLPQEHTILELIEQRQKAGSQTPTVDCIESLFGDLEQFHAVVESYRASQKQEDIITSGDKDKITKAETIRTQLCEDIQHSTDRYVKKLVTRYRSKQAIPAKIHLKHRQECINHCYRSDNKLALLGDENLRLKNIAVSLLAAVSIVGLPLAVGHWKGWFNFFDQPKFEKHTEISALKTPLRRLAQSSPALIQPSIKHSQSQTVLRKSHSLEGMSVASTQQESEHRTLDLFYMSDMHNL